MVNIGELTNIFHILVMTFFFQIFGDGFSDPFLILQFQIFSDASLDIKNAFVLTFSNTVCNFQKCHLDLGVFTR